MKKIIAQLEASIIQYNKLLDNISKNSQFISKQIQKFEHREDLNKKEINELKYLEDQSSDMASKYHAYELCITNIQDAIKSLKNIN